MNHNYAAGQVWLTRSGAKAIIQEVHENDGLEFPIVAWLNGDKITYTPQGNYHAKEDCVEHDFDLISLVSEDKPAEIRDAGYLKSLWIKVYITEYSNTNSPVDAAFRARRATEEFRKEFHGT